ILKKGYEEWNPFQEPKDPIDIRKDKTKRTTQTLVREFLHTRTSEDYSNEYGRGVFDRKTTAMNMGAVSLIFAWESSMTMTGTEACSSFQSGTMLCCSRKDIPNCKIDLVSVKFFALPPRHQGTKKNVKYILCVFVTLRQFFLALVDVRQRLHENCGLVLVKNQFAPTKPGNACRTQ
ncbi:MAG: hypothetical protein JRJ46_07180, partial [Deltaproteobacteria bacterium]|nr:hypothetical protein [Deltaproteobacteria bacterium]